MIRIIEVNLNAAHPELPLVEATTFIGAPSAVFIRGVPPGCGEWKITAVNVGVSYPDNTTTTRAAVRTADGIWTATIPGTATSGRTPAGFKIAADGIDENGNLVTGYVLGFADFAVLSFAPIPAPGETFWPLRYFDTAPAVAKKGDSTTIDGVLKFYNGTAWAPFADLSNYYTAQETNEAIERVAAYYITYNAQGAAFPTAAALLTATTVYSGGVVRTPTRNDYAVVLADETHSGAEWRYIYAVADGQTTGQWEAQYPIETNDYDALSNKPQINGHALTGNQTGADLGVLDLSGGTVNGMVGSKNTNDANAIVGFLGSDIIHRANFNGELSPLFRMKWPIGNGTLALLENISTTFSTSSTYALDQLCVHNGQLYRCTTAIETAESWTAAHWTEATVDDVLAAIRSAMDDKAPLASPAFTGTPTAPTPTAGDDSTKVATTAFVQGALPYAISESTPLTVTSGAAATSLADRTHNVRTVAAPGTGNTTTITATLPPIVAGKSRDMFLNLTVGTQASDAGDISLSIVEPSGATAQIDIGSVEDIGVGENEIMISERALPNTIGNVTTTHWLVTVRHEDFAS